MSIAHIALISVCVVLGLVYAKLFYDRYHILKIRTRLMRERDEILRRWKRPDADS